MTNWETNISSSGKDSVIRGKPLNEVMDMEFSDAIWLTLTGTTPTEDESELFKTVLSSCIDHGIGNPSTVASRTIQSGGNSMNTSVAGGIMALGDKHGGAIENCMKILQKQKTPEEIVKNHLEQGKNIPGLGHKVYDEKDPRTEKILEKAEKHGLTGENTEKIQEIQKVLAEEKVNLVINVDGAIAAVMSDLNWDYRLGKGLFIIARTPGLVAHVHEEMDQKPFRREKGEYKGDKPE